MLGFVKYFAAAHVYRRAKRSVIVLVSATAVLLILVAFSNDLVSTVEGSQRFLVLLAKWSGIAVLSALIWFSARRIAAVAFSPFAKTSAPVDERRKAILAKPHLRSKTDRILERYRKEEA